MKTGDLVTMEQMECIGIIVSITKDDRFLDGHILVYWLKHGVFEGMEQCVHPSQLKLFEEKT